MKPAYLVLRPRWTTLAFIAALSRLAKNDFQYRVAFDELWMAHPLAKGGEA